MSIRSTLKRAVDAAGALLEAPEIPEVESGDLDSLAMATELDSLHDRMRVLERINLEYFEVIERIERERDEWKHMLFTQTSEHQNAQALLQRALSDCSHNLRGALGQLNWFRRAADLAPVDSPAMLETLPTGVPEAFGDKVKAMADGASKQTDGKAERERIAKQLEKIVRE
jgi:hypothetical protein